MVLHHLSGYTSSTLQVYFTLLPILGFTTFHFVTKRRSPRCIPALRSFPSVESVLRSTRLRSPPPPVELSFNALERGVGITGWAIADLPFTALLTFPPFFPVT